MANDTMISIMNFDNGNYIVRHVKKGVITRHTQDENEDTTTQRIQKIYLRKKQEDPNRVKISAHAVNERMLIESQDTAKSANPSGVLLIETDSEGLKHGQALGYRFLKGEAIQCLKGKYENDKRVGKWEEYFPETKITRILNYNEGQLHGISTAFTNYNSPKIRKAEDGTITTQFSRSPNIILNVNYKHGQITHSYTKIYERDAETGQHILTHDIVKTHKSDNPEVFVSQTLHLNGDIRIAGYTNHIQEGLDVLITNTEDVTINTYHLGNANEDRAGDLMSLWRDIIPAGMSIIDFFRDETEKMIGVQEGLSLFNKAYSQTNKAVTRKASDLSEDKEPSCYAFQGNVPALNGCEY